MGFIFVPLSTLAFSTISPASAAEAAGIYSLIGSVGTAIGISVVSTFFARTAQAGCAELSAAGASAHPGHSSAGKGTRYSAFISSLWLITVSLLAMLPLVLLLRSGCKPPGTAMAVAE